MSHYKSVKKELKKALFSTQILPLNIKQIIAEKYDSILKKRTTAIHVRRGDYLKFSKHHPAQTAEYYNNGMELLRNKTDTFIVCSDDIEWCKQNIIGDNVVYIENERDYIELYLISLCDNVIISNSSFGWWGAWLNKNSNKTVIATKQWFGEAISHNESDIIPNKWIKI